MVSPPLPITVTVSATIPSYWSVAAISSPRRRRRPRFGAERSDCNAAALVMSRAVVPLARRPHARLDSSLDPRVRQRRVFARKGDPPLRRDDGLIAASADWDRT